MLNRLKNFRFYNMFIILIVYMLITVALLAERSGLQIEEKHVNNPYLKPEQVKTVESVVSELSPTCLVITDLGREDSNGAYTQFQQIFKDMKIGIDTVDLGSDKMPESFDKYETIVIATPDIEALGDSLITMIDWVKDGGKVMVAMTLDISSRADYLLRKTGVVYAGEYSVVDSVYADKDFMLGGGKPYVVGDAFDSSRNVQLDDDTQAFSWIGDETGNPLVWEKDYGKGRFVVANYGFYEKVHRGLYAAAYTLLDDVSIYPVLDSATFYLDDIPSPVPSGDGTYIKRDYNMDIATFYSNVWFPDVQKLSEKYKVPFTAVMIENYEDKTDGTIEMQGETSRFSFFGNIILNEGGEIGYHGYNHQPLVPSTTDYRGLFEYKTWESEDAMKTSIEELMRFGESVFPTSQLSVYVPPSNILSQEGRELLGGMYPKIKTVSSTYMIDDDGFAYTQEFGVAEDGIVEQPRVISDTEFNDYTMMIQFSELNFHMVVTHFMHPDDTLDVDRGAKLGWPTLYANLDNYMDWLFKTVPDIRRLTGSQLSGTIQRWAGLTISKEWENENKLNIHLGNFIDYGYLMVRVQNKEPKDVKGGNIKKLTESLYLIEAENENVTIDWK